MTTHYTFRNPWDRLGRYAASLPPPPLASRPAAGVTTPQLESLEQHRGHPMPLDAVQEEVGPRGDPGSGPPAKHFGVTLSHARRRPQENPARRRPCPPPARRPWQPWGNPVLRPPAGQKGATLSAAFFSLAPSRQYGPLRQKALTHTHGREPESAAPPPAKAIAGNPVPRRRPTDPGGHLPPGGIKPCTRDLGPTSPDTTLLGGST